MLQNDILTMIHQGFSWGLLPFWRLDSNRELSIEERSYVIDCIKQGNTSGCEPCCWVFETEVQLTQELKSEDIVMEVKEPFLIWKVA